MPLLEDNFHGSAHKKPCNHLHDYVSNVGYSIFIFASVFVQKKLPIIFDFFSANKNRDKFEDILLQKIMTNIWK